MSRKTMGAPSTKPPAVMGRDFASFTGAWAPPVDMPEGLLRAGDCGAGGFDGEGCCPNAAGAETKAGNNHNQEKGASQFEGCEERVFIWRLRVREVRPLAESGRRGCSSASEECRWASGFRWIAQRVRRRGRSARACRWKKDSCPPLIRWRIASRLR